LKFEIALGSAVDEKIESMAEVFHRYIPSLASIERAAEKKAAAERRKQEIERREAEKRSASRLARRGVTALRRERAAHEKIKRLRLEMQVARERGELISREVVLKQRASSL
jgi:hypothetical protein